MATTVNNYKIWCTTDNKWVYGWGIIEPTTCFENNAHGIDATKTVILESVTPTYPLSSLGDKVSVHQSTKPDIPGKTAYAVWSGAGDDVVSNPPVIANGELLQFSLTPGTSQQTKKAYFHSSFGYVWIHEAYLKFESGGIGDYIDSFVVAQATPLTTSGTLTLYVDGNNWVKYTTGTPTATHGFAGNPVLIPRSFSHDGDWNYDGISLTPNFAGTGEYKISSIEQRVHKFVNKIACYGMCYEYFSMTSDETAWLPPGYYVEIITYNNSNTTWNASVIIELYREKTY